MSIGVVLPVGPGTKGNVVEAAVALGREAADAGLTSAWVPQRFDFDSIALAGIVGRAVPELTVGSSVVPIFVRHPILVASQAQTTQAATGGRYTLGLGLGWEGFVEPVFGTPYELPIRRMREFLAVFKSIVDTGGADFVGETIIARTPAPTTVPGGSPVPVLVAAMGPKALRVAGELADGTLPLFAGPKALAEHIVPAITTAAAGRPAPRIVAGVPGLVAADVDAVRDTVAAQSAFYDKVPSYQRIIELSGASKAADLFTIGDEETVAKTVRDYFDAGATEIVFTQTDLGTQEDRRRTWRLLGELAPAAGPPATGTPRRART